MEAEAVEAGASENRRALYRDDQCMGDCSPSTGPEVY